MLGEPRSLNQEVLKKYHSADYQAVKHLFENSFKKAQSLIEQYHDDVLFSKKRNHWVGSTPVGFYLLSATSSYYDGAIKKLKKYKRALSN